MLHFSPYITPCAEKLTDLMHIISTFVTLYLARQIMFVSVRTIGHICKTLSFLQWLKGINDHLGPFVWSLFGN